MTPKHICWCDHIANRGGLPYRTMCLTNEAAEENSQTLLLRGYRRRMQHYGLSVWWAYAPEESTANRILNEHGYFLKREN